MTSKLNGIGTIEERLRRLERALNFAEAILAFPALTIDTVVPFGTPLLSGGIAVDRSVFRQRLPDTRWFVYAAGWVFSNDANSVLLSIVYQKDNTGTVTLGTSTVTPGAAQWLKLSLGPFDVFGTPGVPAGETIPMIRFAAQKNVAGSTTVANWNLWLRLMPSKQ